MKIISVIFNKQQTCHLFIPTLSRYSPIHTLYNHPLCCVVQVFVHLETSKLAVFKADLSWCCDLQIVLEDSPKRWTPDSNANL